MALNFEQVCIIYQSIRNYKLEIGNILFLVVISCLFFLRKVVITRIFDSKQNSCMLD